MQIELSEGSNKPYLGVNRGRTTMQTIAIVKSTGASPATSGCHSSLQNMIERVRCCSGTGGQKCPARKNLNLAGIASITASRLADILILREGTCLGIWSTTRWGLKVNVVGGKDALSVKSRVIRERECCQHLECGSRTSLPKVPQSETRNCDAVGRLKCNLWDQ